MRFFSTTHARLTQSYLLGATVLLEAYEQVYVVVRRIPKGKVLTYGLVSHMVNERLSAQGVGWAMAALASVKTKDGNKAPVPWHRVINSKGGLSTQKNPNIPPGLQRAMLEKEGVVFDEEEKIELSRYLWKEGLSDSSE